MRVIGAGLPRTATTTQMVALEQLGFAPCYHMRETIWGMFHGDSVIHHVSRARAVLDPIWRRYIDLMQRMNWDERTGGGTPASAPPPACTAPR